MLMLTQEKVLLVKPLAYIQSSLHYSGQRPIYLVWVARVGMLLTVWLARINTHRWTFLPLVIEFP